ncbi:MAG: proline dehydrogenase family protein [Phycisphaerae bacterium]
MAQNERLNQRALEIGREIFERAERARPKCWQKAWWLEQATHLLERDEELKTRAFMFVDCLPALRTPADIARHVDEYFGLESVNLPPALRALASRGTPQTLREECIGWGARFAATQMAGRFITGYNAPSAIRTIERLRERGMGFTIDVLGESTTSHAGADRYAAVYHELIDSLTAVARRWRRVRTIDEDSRGPMPAVNLSIKLTGLDPHFDPIAPERAAERVGQRLRPLLRHARQAGAFVNIDMESSRHRRLTLDVFKAVLLEDEFRDWSDIGIAIQAYLTDGERDLEELLEWGGRRGSRFTIRLVKGAYWDAETAAAVRAYKVPPVWTNKWESDACYERMTRVMLEGANLIRPAFASHNVRSLAVALAAAAELGLSPRDYEVQMLYGMGDPLKTAMVELRQYVRVYCPYGDLMPGMGYLIRRLLENTSNDGFLRQSFSDRGSHDRLLDDPTVARPPSISLPARHYQDTNPEETMSAFTNASNTNFAESKNRAKMIGALEYVHSELGRRYSMMIGGESVAADTHFETINPSRPREVVGVVADGTTGDIDRAVAAARKAFRHWRATTAHDRANLLRLAADRIEARRFELAATMILEVGKPWREADADVTEAVDHCRYYADQIERIEARPRVRNIPGENNMLVYSPKGVCAVVSPWAFPLALLTGMSTAALAAGNTVVIKPARQASAVASKLVEVLRDVGFPPGTVNFVPGKGDVIGQYLVEHGEVNIVAFTGSREVGTGVLRAGSAPRSGQPFIRKMIVEMGGKNAIIVDDDADVDGAVQAIIDSAFSFAGQKCSSCSRLVVLDGIYEHLMPRLREAVDSIPIGPADHPEVHVGPVIDAEAQTRIHGYAERGLVEGRLFIKAKLPAICADGFFVAPMIFTEVMPDACIAQEEIFGPLLAVIRVPDFDRAIAVANGTRYALTGGVFSRSPGNIDLATREFAVGNLYINRKITGSQVDAQPFGGFKLSGTGVKAGSPDYLLHFTDARCITENTARSGLVPDEHYTQVP